MVRPGNPQGDKVGSGNTQMPFSTERSLSIEELDPPLLPGGIITVTALDRTRSFFIRNVHFEPGSLPLGSRHYPSPPHLLYDCLADTSNSKHPNAPAPLPSLSVLGRGKGQHCSPVAEVKTPSTLLDSVHSLTPFIKSIGTSVNSDFQKTSC